MDPSQWKNQEGEELGRQFAIFCARSSSTIPCNTFKATLLLSEPGCFVFVMNCYACKTSKGKWKECSCSRCACKTPKSKWKESFCKAALIPISVTYIRMQCIECWDNIQLCAANSALLQSSAEGVAKQIVTYGCQPAAK